VDAPSVVIGIVAIALGAGLMLLGYRLALILLPIWGFFAGFIFGAHVLQELLGQGFLATTLSWVGGAIVGLVFAVLSYLFWYVAVVVAFASVGYWLGWGLVTLLAMSGTGLAAFGIGLGVGVILALLAVVTGVPLVALVVMTAVAGSHAFTAGVLVLLGVIDVTDLGTGVVTAIISANLGWWLAALGMALVSSIVQLQTMGEHRLEPPAARI
jgi:hypothetical protein